MGWVVVIATVLCLGVLVLVVRAKEAPRERLANWRLKDKSGVNVPELPPSAPLYQSRVTVSELEALVARFIGTGKMRDSFHRFSQQRGELLSPHLQASSALIRHCEYLLTAAIGSASARIVLASALQERRMQLEEIAAIVDEASELFDFSRSLLQGAIEHINQGISVVDKQLRLVAWNQRYVELFDLPSELVQIGRPIADVIRYNAERGLCGGGDIEEQVRRRVAYLGLGSPHRSSRQHPDGRVIEVQGNPMPGGGFVMSFNDITVFRAAEQALKQSNETLEARVVARTQELELLNRQLISATEKAELTSQSKSRLLAAVSHDLVQPLNAARLFASSLAQAAKDEEVQVLSGHIESALGAAEDLISDLLDISRLESGKMKAKFSVFALDDVFSILAAEFGVIAQQQGINFCVQSTKLYIRSDKKLLRRVLQNFLTNAFRYNPKGRVVLGVRRKAHLCQIQVWDDGAGIALNRQQDIFEEFTRIDKKGAELGLGLGLAIAKKISLILEQQLSLRSWPEICTVFAIDADRANPSQIDKPSIKSVADDIDPLTGLTIFCIDNEKNILLGMQSLLEQWHCHVHVADDIAEFNRLFEQSIKLDVILSDYHLAPEFTGIDALLHCRAKIGDKFLGVVITADRSLETRKLIQDQGFHYLAKPVKALKLRALLQQHCR